jgi:hypothetical protein
MKKIKQWYWVFVSIWIVFWVLGILFLVPFYPNQGSLYNLKALFLDKNNLAFSCLLITAPIYIYLILKLIKKIVIPKKSTEEFKQGQLSQDKAIFIDLSPKSADLVELAVEFWRIKSRLVKASVNLDDIQKRGLESSVQKLIKYLDRFHIEIADHTNQKYNEGLSVDVLSFENDPSVSVPMIKETVEPTIICEGKVVKKGKVVVIKNN